MKWLVAVCGISLLAALPAAALPAAALPAAAGPAAGALEAQVETNRAAHEADIIGRP